MSSITKRFMSFVGKNRLEDIVDPKLRAVVIGYCDAQEKKVPQYSLLLCNAKLSLTG